VKQLYRKGGRFQKGKSESEAKDVGEETEPYSEHEGSMFFLNVGNHPTDFTAS
jgi:hypothetical protein